MKIPITNLFIITLILLGLTLEFWFKYLFFISFLTIILIVDKHFITSLITSLLIGALYAGLFSQAYFLIVFPLSVIVAKIIFYLFADKLISDILAGILSLFSYFSFLGLGFLGLNFDYLAASFYTLLFIYQLFLMAVFWWIILRVILFLSEKSFNKKIL